VGPRPIRIIADDLTGAADAGATFLVAGPVTLTLGAGAAYWEDPGRAVVAADTATREADAAAATAAVAGLAGRVPGHGEVFKKVDSALRGHVAVEIGVLRDLFPERLVVFAPAFPRNGRVTRCGVQHIGGVPLHLGDHWVVEAGDPPGSLPELLTGHPSGRIDLDAVRTGGGRLAGALQAAGRGGVVAVCDAEIDGDLDRIVEAGRAAGPEVIWVGSAGLASALGRARRRPGTPHADPGGSVRGAGPGWTIEGSARSHGRAGPTGTGPARPARRSGPYLAVIGSAAAPARRQARVLAAEGGAQLVELEASTLAHAGPAAIAELVEEVRTQSTRADAVVTVSGEVDSRWAATITASLARVTAPAAQRASALVLAGGATARAVLDACGVGALDLIAELDPGIVLARPVGAPPVPVVTKSGAFGDDRTLWRAVQQITFEEGST
jgi:uncharacterized protein YgbK (DUF1537 family)